MADRLIPTLRILCLGLGGLVIYQFSGLFGGNDPLRNLRVPAALMAAAASTNRSPSAASEPAKATNAVSSQESVRKGTNPPPTTGPAAPPNERPPHHPIPLPLGGGEGVRRTGEGAVQGPNPRIVSGTSLPRGAMMSGPRQGPGMVDPSLPPTVRTRVERIVQSEILGPIIRPLPMALLGIGGNEAFLRAPNGQSGLVKEGEELGGVKLLRIGTNRILIEHEGQQKELMIFSGLGSETLLSKEKESPK